ncbi:MAG: hypothetical protein ACK6DW_05360 [Betaproteobacteria bacterium]|jgi:hypothetical protein
MRAPSPASERQDAAAGGRHLRELVIEEGHLVMASIEALKSGHNMWGYLRFKIGGRTIRRYVGRVTAPTPDECLQLGWKLVRQLKTAEASGWMWVNKPPKAKK